MHFGSYKFKKRRNMLKVYVSCFVRHDKNNKYIYKLLQKLELSENILIIYVLRKNSVLQWEMQNFFIQIVKDSSCKSYYQH